MCVEPPDFGGNVRHTHGCCWEMWQIFRQRRELSRGLFGQKIVPRKANPASATSAPELKLPQRGHSRAEPHGESAPNGSV